MIMINIYSVKYVKTFGYSESHLGNSMCFDFTAFYLVWLKIVLYV